MKTRMRSFMFLTAIISMLAFSAMRATSVLADGETPPPPTDVPVVAETPAPVDAPAADALAATEAPAATDVPVVTDTPAPTDSTTTTDTPAVTDAAAAPTDAATRTDSASNSPATVSDPTSAPSADAPVADLLSQVPSGTVVVVVDANGAAVPLASQTAADAVATADPMWCPAGVTPGGAGCTSSFTSFDDLLGYLTAHPKAANGVIWIQGNYDSSVNDSLITAFTLDGNSGTGVCGSANCGSNGSYNLATMAGYSLTIKGGWTGSGAGVDTSDPSEFNVPLNIVNWRGNVTLSDIVVTGTTSGTNALKVTINPSYVRNVSLARVESKNNTGNGITITTKGVITLTDIASNDNTGYGASLDNTANISATAPAGVTLTGTNIFAGNTLYGLQVTSKGVIKAANTNALANGGFGAKFDNQFSPTRGAVLLTGANNFKFNTGGDGLTINSKGAISVSNISAADNSTGNGASLKNTFGSSAILQAVTLTGVNVFVNNGLSGLEVTSYGVITVNYVTSTNNGKGGVTGFGAKLDNSGSTGKLPTTLVPPGVTVNGTNIFNGNFNTGLKIMTKGAVVASNITANSNARTNPAVDDNLGLEIQAVATGSVSPVTISGTNFFNDNKGRGISISANGNIVLSNVTANNSMTDHGAYIFNAQTPSAPRNVTLTGTNVFNGNNAIGIKIDTFGVISLSNINASFNGASTTTDYGAILTNDTGTLARAVTLTGINTFNGNAAGGLKVSSLGAITISNLTANDNTGTLTTGQGAVLYNHTTANQKVTLSGVNTFNNNFTDGLKITANGQIVLNSVTANSNGSNGANLDNHTSTGGVNITGASFFSHNTGVNGGGGDGLKIVSNGVVTMTKITADGNAINGLDVTTVGNVTLTCGSFTNNGSYGWILDPGSSAYYLYIKGVVSYGNAVPFGYPGYVPVSHVVTVRTCPLP